MKKPYIKPELRLLDQESDQARALGLSVHRNMEELRARNKKWNRKAMIVISLLGALVGGVSASFGFVPWLVSMMILLPMGALLGCLFLRFPE